MPVSIPEVDKANVGSQSTSTGLQPAIGPVTSTPVTKYMTEQVANPDIPAGGIQTVIPFKTDPEEFLSTPGQTAVAPAKTSNATATTQAPASTATVQNVDPNAFVSNVNTYQASTVDENNIPQATAATDATVNANSLTSTRMAELLNYEAGETPTWALGAVRDAEQKMAARGLGQSSMAAEAITAAILEASIPIAEQEAATYAQLQSINLSNRQQTSLANLDARMQTLTNNAAMENAAKQFNSTGEMQTSEFMAGLRTTISQANADRAGSLEQSNVAQINTVNAQNAQNETAISQANAENASVMNRFNAQVEDARLRFNTQNQQIINQSNVAWRRSINTANTAAQNSANQINAQNSFNLSNQALANIWQQFRDEASWAETSSENSQNRAHNMAVAALQRQTSFDLNEEADKQELYQLMGEFGLNVVSNIF